MNKDEKTLYTFIETPIFRQLLDDCASLDMLYAIQADLLAEPERWPVIKGTNGARKGRIASPDSPDGKRGGFRYLYLYLELRGRIHLIYLFDKRKQADLTMEQKKAIAAVVEAIKKSVQ